jgi:hypothetical protein
VVVLFFFYNDLFHNTSPDQGKPFFEVEDGTLVLRNSPVAPPRDGGTVRRPEPRTLRLEPWRGSMALRLLTERASANPQLHRLLADWGLAEPPRTDALIPELWPVVLGRRREVDEMWRRTEAILAALDAEVRKDGARLLLFYVPEHSEVDEAIWEATRRKYRLGRRAPGFDKVYRRLAETASRLGIPVVAPHAALRAAEARGSSGYFRHDGHWNETGHAIAADEVARFVRERGWTGCGEAVAAVP